MRPLTVKLVSMPFAPLDAPSLALTQLRAVLQRRFTTRIDVEIHYAAFDFVRHLDDPDLYRHALSSTGFLTHFGDWFFAREAFPDAPATTCAYLERFYHEQDGEPVPVRRLVGHYRPILGSWLDHLIDARHLLEADVVGFTSMFLQNTASIALARRLKERKPGLITVMGGPACEGVPGLELVRRVPALDYVFSGPALVSFPAFMGRLLEREMNALDCLNGVFSRGNCDASFAENQPPGVAMLGDEADIDDLIPLDYEEFLDAYGETFGDNGPQPYLLFETSRGCWWGERGTCSFCGLNGLRACHRAMSPSAAIRYLQALYPYAGRARCFVATDNILPRDYPGQVFARLRPPPGFRLKYETRADLDFTALKQLQQACVVALQPGIESLSTPALRLMRKGTTAFQNLRFLKACAQLPMAIEWNLLVGSPGESGTVYAKYLRDIPLLHHLPPPQAAFPVMFVRHSRYHERPGEHGLELVPQEFYSHIYPFDASSLERIATMFVNRAPDAPRLEPWLKLLNEVIRQWQVRWSNSDGREPARLRLTSCGGVWEIVDSRPGERLAYEISQDARRVLELLEEPKSRHALAEELAGSGIDLEVELDFLLRNGLLFEESGCYLSLVAAG